ncbi:hypothetical protein Q1695_007390 [Nippostrongylus brasiliensis]|nr:hypothetical protein Q1695_007390 [Nippostrongylus brasiliensis]
MESGSVFDFIGSAKMMRLKVSLIEKGLVSNLDDEAAPGSFTRRTIDEVQIQWQQKVSPLSEHAGVEQDKWIAQNAVVDLPLKRKVRAIRCEKRLMYIMAYLGNLAGPYDKDDEYVVCRITLLNDRSMIFEPRLTHEGYRMHSKLGEYIAMVHVWDDYFTPIEEQLSRVNLVPPIPETHSFEVPDEGSTKGVTMLCIEYAEDFNFENLWVEYAVYFSENISCTTNNVKGRTSACTSNEDGRFNFSIPIELDFTAADVSMFHIRFRVRAEDFWGRQYVAGYGSLTPLLQPGRTDYRVCCWRPIRADDRVCQLREFFIGQAVDIDYFNLNEDGVISRVGLTTESSGNLHVSITNVLQRRDYIARETLNHMKYGAMFDRMGLRSDLYWRIMKVLMEFEEAKRQLLYLRAVN